MPGSPKRKGHANPFNGKCIHGKEGASFVRGVLYNPGCQYCVQAQKGESK